MIFAMSLPTVCRLFFLIPLDLFLLGLGLGLGILSSFSHLNWFDILLDSLILKCVLDSVFGFESCK